MRINSFAIALTAISVPAYAQTSTNCSWIGNTWSCNSQPSAPQIDWASMQRQQQENAAQQRQMWANIAQQQELRRIRQAQEAQARALQAQADAMQAQQRQAQLTPSQKEHAKEFELRSEVSEMLKNGHCQLAQDTALDGGDIELANEAKAYCAKP